MHAAVDQAVLWAIGVDQSRIFAFGRRWCGMGGQHLPCDREVRKLGIDAGFKGDEGDAFAPETRGAGGDGGLVGEGGMTPKALRPGMSKAVKTPAIPGVLA